jgi:hypothetical protein
VALECHDAGEFLILRGYFLQLARAQVMMGDKAAARKSYQDFPHAL